MPRRMKIAVTGGCGILGSAISQELSARTDHHVISLDVVEAHGCSEYRYLDVLRYGDVVEALGDVDMVVHAAALLGTDDPEERMFQVNVAGTWNVLEAAKRSGVSKVVIISSECASSIINISGVESVFPEYLPVDEHQALKPRETYGLTKQLSEIVAQGYARRGAFQVVVLRPTLIIHPDMKRYVNDVRDQDDPGLWSYVELRDVVQAARLAVSYDGPLYDVFYLSAKDTFSKEPTLDFVRRKFGRLPELRWPELYHRNPYASIWDISHAIQRLGWHPESDWRVCIGGSTL